MNAFARAIVLLLVLWYVPSSAGCGGLPPCASPPNGMTLVIDVEPALADGTVTTSGACTPASCADPSDSGASRCLQWRAEMTGALDTKCDVTLLSPNGERRAQLATVEVFCRETFVRGMQFRLSDPRDAAMQR